MTELLGSKEFEKFRQAAQQKEFLNKLDLSKVPKNKRVRVYSGKDEQDKDIYYDLIIKSEENRIKIEINAGNNDIVGREFDLDPNFAEISPGEFLKLGNLEEKEGIIKIEKIELLKD